MNFKRQPFINDREFLFQFVDVAKRSDIIGIDCHHYLAHGAFLYFRLLGHLKPKALQRFTCQQLLYTLYKNQVPTIKFGTYQKVCNREWSGL